MKKTVYYLDLTIQTLPQEDSPCAAHDLWSIEGEGVILIRL